MKIEKITATYSRKWNLGDYESVEASAFLCAELDDPNDDPELVSEYLNVLAKKAVKQAVIEVLNANEYQGAKAQTIRRYMGKQLEDWTSKLDEALVFEEF